MSTIPSDPSRNLDVAEIVEKLVREHGGEDRELWQVSVEPRVAAIMREMESFGARHQVQTLMQEWSPYGIISGVHLTDFFADTPGLGLGSVVLQRMIDLADALELSVYVRPGSGRNRILYERFGFDLSANQFGCLVRYARPSAADHEVVSTQDELMASPVPRPRFRS